MKLSKAVLCLNEVENEEGGLMACEEVYEATGSGPSCPRCGSGSFFPLASWVNTRYMADRGFTKLPHLLQG